MTKLARELLFPLIAVVAAFIVGGILILIVGDNPFVAYRLLLGSALSWPDGVGYVLFHATPLIFTGLAVLVGFRCGLFNRRPALHRSVCDCLGRDHTCELIVVVTRAALFRRGDSEWRLVGRDSRCLESALRFA
jgi:hypothetical protein